MPHPALKPIREKLAAGKLIPYLGPGMLARVPDCPVPATHEELASLITSGQSMPHRIRHRLTAVAQFIENFKHRKTLTGLMHQYFSSQVEPSALHRFIAAQPALPLVVDAWYDDALQNALRERRNWGQVQGLSQAENFGTWYGWYDAFGQPAHAADAQSWETLLYKPLGGANPGDNFIVSDSDFVEVLTEIDIQTPIPPAVQTRRAGCGFLFLGCRFNDQLERSFARQIMKRSSDRHWAVLPCEPSRNEARFMDEQRIERIALPLAEFESALF